MKLNQIISPYAPVKKGETIYFHFEEDFVSDNIRCIPMIVRFKLDACGIKLKLSEWSRFSPPERNKLAEFDCSTLEMVGLFKNYVQELVISRTGHEATECLVEENPGWADTDSIISALHEQASLYRWQFSQEKWRKLNNLQRFALMKLCRPGHENKNFPKAMLEFGMTEIIK